MSVAESDIVQFDNVGLRYGTEREVLSNISFTLFSGRFYFLTGESGAGKTSLLKLLYLAQRPSRGAIRMFGRDVITLPRDKLPAYRRRMGVVFQDFRLVDHLSAFDNIALPPTAPMRAPQRFRAASSSASRLRARSSGVPRSSWPTSRPVTSIPTWL